MSETWENFISNVNEDGRASAYLFEWTLPPLPELVGSSANLKLMSTSLPGSEIEELTTYWQGLQYKCGGSRRFTDWTATIMCDESGFTMGIRTRFELWISEINAVLPFIQYARVPNLREGGYYRPQVLQILNGAGKSTHTITIVDSWPKSIGEISLDRYSTDFAHFDVTFGYNYSFIIPNII
jgi:hypothetical protein